MNRVIYSANTLLVSDSPGSDSHTGIFDLKLIDRVQDAKVTVSTQIKRFKQIGSKDFLFNNYYVPPQIACNISYYNSDTSNEAVFGINVDGSCIYSSFAQTGKDINLFLLSDNVDGRDVSRLADFNGVNVFGVGNAFLTNYSVRAGVNEVPVTSVDFVGNNIIYDTYTGSNQIPSLTFSGKKPDYQYSFESDNFTKANYVTSQNERPIAIRPGDIQLIITQPSLAGGLYNSVSGKIQNFNVNIPFERRELNGFGNNFAFDRKLMYPSVGTISFNALFDQIYTGNYSTIFNFDERIEMEIKLSDCDNSPYCIYKINDAKLVSENFNFNIGNQVAFDGSFEFPITIDRGFSISGRSELFDSDAVAFLEAADITETRIRTGINNFVISLKDSNLWSKMSGIYPFVGGTEYSHQYNLKDPRDSNSAFRLDFVGAGTSHTYSGVEFMGSNDYANVFFNPNTNLSGLPVHVSALSLSDASAYSVDIGSANVGMSNPRMVLLLEYGTTNAAFDSYSFSAGEVVISNVNSQAFYTASRINSTSGFMMLFNSSETPTKSEVNVTDVSGQTKPNYDVFLGAVNAAGTPTYANTSNRKFGFFSIGNGLTSGECVDLYSAVKQLQLDLNRNQQVFT